MKKESSLCYTIGLIGELIRIHLIEVMKCYLLQDLCMQGCYTVDGITTNDCKICHAYLTVIDDCHASDTIVISRETGLDILDKSTVDLFYDLIDTRQKTCEDFDGPLL